jgi:molecular chaperone DnaK
VDEALSKCKKELDKDEKNAVKNDLANLRKCLRKDKPERMNDAEEAALRDAKSRLEASASHLMCLYTEQQGQPENDGTDQNL